MNFQQGDQVSVIDMASRLYGQQGKVVKVYRDGNRTDLGSAIVYVEFDTVLQARRAAGEIELATETLALPLNALEKAKARRLKPGFDRRS